MYSTFHYYTAIPEAGSQFWRSKIKLYLVMALLEHHIARDREIECVCMCVCMCVCLCVFVSSGLVCSSSKAIRI
jgi:hypothetical protein